MQTFGRDTWELTEQEIIGFIHSRGGSTSLSEILAGLDLPQNMRKYLKNGLADLCHRNILSCSRNIYEIRKAAALIEGVLSVHPRGYAFATIEERVQGVKEGEDLFVPPNALETANHGDRVLLQVFRRGKRVEGRVVRVLGRAAREIVGLYTAGRTTGLVIPEDDRLLFQVVIPKQNSCGARNGDAVVVDITEFKSEQRNPVGRIVEVLGDPEDLGVQAEITIRKFGLPHRFDEQIRQQVSGFSDQVTIDSSRRDLRDTVHVTIDGEDARDFDDAVGLVRTERGGYRLYVSIADVSHYVSPGTPVDREAYLRGTSVYFPNRVVPMLPERLSNDLCSLVPDKDRLAFTAVLDFDRGGKRIKKEFFRSIIRSRHRLTYTIVKQMLVDHDIKARKKYTAVLEMLEGMAELAGHLESRRMKRGSIGFDLPEPFVVFDEAGKVAAIVRRERNMAHKLIEEFMLAANEAVAQTLAEKKAESLYRIHEQPDPAKVEEFAEFTASLGLNVPKDQGTPQWFGRVLALSAGTPREYIINNLMLRTMNQARYSEENVGHFGLAAEHYTHFTSPIRRYPDLIVHRTLAAFLAGGGKEKKTEAKQLVAMHEAGLFLSKRERVAVDAEREMDDRIKVRFMAGKIGERFQGIVSGMTSFGIFVELLDSFISGAVVVEEMQDDFYHYDERSHTLTGSRTGKRYQIGDLVEVEVKNVELHRRRITFAFVE